MSLAVVRCPACLGASRVVPDAIGQMVACPRCEVPFVAVEDAPVVHPTTRSRPVSPRRPPAAVVPVAPPRPRPLLFSEAEEPESTAPSNIPSIPDPEHDPHSPPPAGLPISVLIGLALLPYGIPVLWWATPTLTGQAAALSLAVPISLAFAASTLCLGVVYTIDWTATTRIKGVLMLVSLAYLSAAGLYFLKKEMVERVQRLGGDSDPWVYVSSREGNCQLQMPGHVWTDENEQPVPGVRMVDVRCSQYFPKAQNGPKYAYCFAVSKPDLVAKKAAGEWFDRLNDELKNENGAITAQRELRHREDPEAPGREWIFARDGKVNRIVQVFVIKGRVYYLSAEGPGLKETDEDYSKPFFDRFLVLNR